MWKKFLVVCVCLVGTFSIVYANESGWFKGNVLRANGTNTYQAGGEVTGRINQAPSDFIIKDIGMKKGDKILMDVKNPSNNSPLIWQLIQERTYTDYNCSTTTVVCNGSDQKKAWLSLTLESVAYTDSGLTPDDFQFSNGAIDGTDAYRPLFSNYRNIVSILDDLNNKVELTNDKKLIEYRDLTSIHNGILKGTMATVAEAVFRQAIFSRPSDYTNHIFLPNTYELISAPFGISDVPETNDLKFETDYMGSSSGSRTDHENHSIYFTKDGGRQIGVSQTYNMNLNVRLQTYLNLNNVVFGLSQGSTSEIAKISVPTLASNYSALYKDAKGEPMKVRIKDSALTDSTKFNQIENITGSKITQAEKDSTIKLNINAKEGMDGKGGVNTVSVLIFDQNNNFLYYKPLEPAKGAETYNFDTTDIPLGKYKIGIVNEVYNENSTAPANSSLISDLKDLEIVSPLSDLTYTPSLGNDTTDLEKVYQATDSGDYATSSNNTIGTVTSKNGVGNATVNGTFENGISYTVIESSASSQQNDASKFKVAVDTNTSKPILDANGKPYIIPNLETGKTYLSPGVYQYRIQALDANGDPYKVDDTDSSITYPIDKNGNAITSGITVDKGLISDEITTIVYPSADMLDVTMKKFDNETPEDTKDDRLFNSKEIDQTTELAELKFNDDANIQSLLDEGYSVESITFKKKGTTTVIDNFYAEPDVSNINIYTMKWDHTKTLLTGKTEMDVYVTFKNNDSSTGVIKKTGIELMIYDTFDLTKLKWQKKDTVPQSFGDVQGTITTSGMNSNELSVGFVSQGSFYTQITQLDGYSDLTGASIEYSLKQGSTSGIISVAQNGKVTILKTSPDNADVKIQAKITKDGFQDAYVYLPVKIAKGQTTFSYVDQNGNELSKNNDKYNPYQVGGKNIAYSKNGKLQLYTSGNPKGTTVSYALKSNSPADVVSVKSDTGEVTILNATTALQKDKVIVVATAHDPSGNYADVSIELPINIDKAKQTISFVENPINVANGKGTIVPEVKAMDLSSNNGGAQVSDTKYIIAIDDSKCTGCASTSDGKEIAYEYEGDEGIDITLRVSKPGNRNYENVGPVETILHITGKEETVFEISKPSKITYGDHFKIQSLQDDSGSTDVKYEFTLDNTTYIKKNDETDNDATGEFDAIAASGTNNIEITVKRTATGELPISKKVVVKVLPKDIKIKINDQEKLKGETNPTLTYQEFNSQLISWNGTQDVIQSGDVKLSTTATVTSAKGGYPITGDHAYLNKTYPNYSFTFTNGTLTVKEDNIEDNWYHLELDDGKNTVYNGKWTNKDVNIISDHDEYVNVSKDQSTWAPNKVTVSTEGKTEQSFWLKKASGAITGEKKETILIDKTAPTLTSVTAKDSRNQLQVLISTLSNGFFFRPNTTFEITTSDTKEKLETSGTTSIDYKLYDSDKKLIKQDTLSVTKEKASVMIENTTGTYQLCMILKDQAGNESGELCKTVELKEIGQDSDGDGIPDINIDTDGDGKPDLNITKKQCTDLDEDRDCRIPYLNIDTKGDGQPDMNIDTDGDGTPDLNTGIVKEWKPDTLVDLDKDDKPDYKTSSTLKGLNNIDTDGDHYPDLNIDRDLDGIPELNINTDGKLDKPQTNIDGNGDGIANINIDENGDGIPEKNVMDITEWKPEHNVTSDGKVIYDTMKLTFKEVDELEDNGIKVQPSDPNVSFLPNMALKVDDITANTSEDTKKDIIKDSGETDKEVKKVYDVKLLEDNKVIQPDGSLKVSIPVDETIQNAKVMMKAKDGTWKVMEVKVENGYYVFETDYIGEVSVIGDPEVSDVEEPTQTPEPNPDVKDGATTNPTVQGTYTAKATYPGNNVGGASTGDYTNILLFGILGTLSMTMILVLYLKKKREDNK